MNDAAMFTAERIFEAHLRRDRELADIAMLMGLPRERAVLIALQACCMRQAQKALAAGHHTEGRRFGNLARQLQQRIEAAGS